jgi:transmembrane sensor
MTTGESLEPLIEQATDWLLRLEEAPGDSSLRAAAESWRATNATHAQAWVRAERAYRMIAQSAPPAHAEPSAARRRWTHRWAAGAVAAMAAGLLLLYMPGILAHLRADIVTETAELRQITLEDGTVIELAPQTAIDVRFSRERRSVALLSGEAFFDVAPQPDRPFDVQAKDLTVTVVGTAFDVRVSDGALTVGVQRGAVEARAARANPVHLGPGDQLTIERRSGAMQQTRIPPEEVASWRDHRLFVEGASVAEVVEELRRYRSGWIVFADSKLAHRQVTGLYDLRDPDRALRALIGPFGGQVREIAPLLTVVSSP